MLVKMEAPPGLNQGWERARTNAELILSLTTPEERPVPAGFVLHTESTTSILFASVVDPTGKPQVFLNPVQQYNRDLSIVAIRTWSEQRQQERATLWEASMRKRRAKGPTKRRALGEADEEGGTKKRKVEDGEAEVSARPAGIEVRGVVPSEGRARVLNSECSRSQGRTLIPIHLFLRRRPSRSLAWKLSRRRDFARFAMRKRSLFFGSSFV